ncbi:hypothetical protein AB0O87_13070 [Microbacterium sp. NPDC076768]|uniref:hypothetical protein n=1 Tax=Microbacterium sp. NPDC076768 TaxID=3154858 RepID=UPI0034233B2C
MNRNTVQADLQVRGYVGYCFFEDPRGKQNVIVLSAARNGFQSWIQDERAQLISGSLRTFTEENDALTDFTHRVELWNRISGLRPQR